MPLPVLLALIQLLGPPAVELIRVALIPLVKKLVEEMTDDEDERQEAVQGAQRLVAALDRHEA